MVKSGDYRAEKVRYPDGVGCCVWKKFKDESDEDSSGGLCFDFSWEEYGDMLNVLQGLKDDAEKVYEPDPEHEKFEAERKVREKDWLYQLHKVFEDVGIQIVPFDWQFRRFFITRPVAATKKSDELCGKWCKGFHIGPVVVTW